MTVGQSAGGNTSLIFFQGYDYGHPVAVIREFDRTGDNSRDDISIQFLQFRTVWKNSCYIYRATHIRFEAYYNRIVLKAADHRMGSEHALASHTNRGVSLTDITEPSEMCDESRVGGSPIHVGTESLIAIYVEAGVAQTATRFIAVENLADTRSKQKGCGTVDHNW